MFEISRTTVRDRTQGFFQARMSSLNYTGCPCRHGNPSARRDIGSRQKRKREVNGERDTRSEREGCGSVV